MLGEGVGAFVSRLFGRVSPSRAGSAGVGSVPAELGPVPHRPVRTRPGGERRGALAHFTVEGFLWEDLNLPVCGWS